MVPNKTIIEAMI
jgi:hypothetical protein